MEDFLNLIFLAYKKLSANNIQILLLLIKSIICIFGGLIITFAHSYFSFSWLRNNFNIYVGMSLPVIGLIITTVIGSNIALSIGMLGALSIVRFRTPIRTPYELVHYFSLLTLGISANVDISIALYLIIILSAAPFFITHWNKTDKSLTKSRKIILNLSSELNVKDLEFISSEPCVKTFQVEKKNKNYILNLIAHFDNQKDKNEFIKKWSSKIKSYDVTLDDSEPNS